MLIFYFGVPHIHVHAVKSTILSLIFHIPHRLATQVQVVKVLVPATPISGPVKPASSSVDEQAIQSTDIPNGLPPESKILKNGEASDSEITACTNGVNENSVNSIRNSTTSGAVSTPENKPTVKTPRTPLAPLSPETSLNPEDYRYIVKDSADPERVREVPAVELNRPKGVFTTAKLKLLLRSVLYRKSDKHPFAVKVRICNK